MCRAIVKKQPRVSRTDEKNRPWELTPSFNDISGAGRLFFLSRGFTLHLIDRVHELR